MKDDEQQRSEDDLTHVYSNIIKVNNFLKQNIADPDSSQYTRFKYISKNENTHENILSIVKYISFIKNACYIPHILPK